MSTAALRHSMLHDDALATEFRAILGLDEIFGELIAGYFAEPGYLVDEDGNYLTDEDGNRLLIR